MTNTAAPNWCTLPTPMGRFRMYDTGDEDVRIVCMGNINAQGDAPLLRIHSSCLASEVFGALDCDCADQLREAMKRIANEGKGIVIHLHQEGRGQGLSKKIRAVRLMETVKFDTVEAFEALGLEQDTRDYTEAVKILKRFKLNSVRLISNNPRKRRFLEHSGIRVSSENTHPNVRLENEEYLHTKNEKLGHNLPLEDASDQADILFYHSDQPWGELSNFSRHSVFLHDRVWPTVEHFYQAQKFIDRSLVEKVRRCHTPMLAKIMASSLTEEHRREDWGKIKETVMLEGLRAKFEQHPDLREQLVESGERLLIEHTRNDNYWGDGGNGVGANRLGKLLMQVRAALRQPVGPAQHYPT
jgi:GTP cyclohydrolase II